MRMKQQWVICQYFPYDPMDVYGMFDSEKEAIECAERQKFGLYNDAYSIHSIRDVKEEPES
jgi:hypothetical protein